jgi:hypothetical protein
MQPSRLDDRIISDRAQGTGARYWYFPDGDLPWPDQHGPFRGHESLLVLNVCAIPATLGIDLFWTDSDPVLGIHAVVAPERLAVLHPPYGERDAADRPVSVPVRRQYALRLRSSVPVICQFGRIECRPSFATYTTMGWSAADAS